MKRKIRSIILIFLCLGILLFPIDSFTIYDSVEDYIQKNPGEYVVTQINQSADTAFLYLADDYNEKTQGQSYRVILTKTDKGWKEIKWPDYKIKIISGSDLEKRLIYDIDFIYIESTNVYFVYCFVFFPKGQFEVADNYNNDFTRAYLYNKDAIIYVTALNELPDDYALIINGEKKHFDIFK